MKFHREYFKAPIVSDKP